MGLSSLFVPPDDLGIVPQLFLMAAYGYILFTASKTMSDGCEMLLGIYGPGIIGGLVIPILGAVPDSAIILVSGLGDKAEVQQQLSVGVGTLAGSTIMLLTLPWAAGVFLGRRDLDPSTGQAATVVVDGKTKAKYTSFSLTENVVTSDENVPVFAKVMMATSISYLIIQIPAFFDKNSSDASSREAPFALAGFIITLIGFIAYSAYQLIDARHGQFVAKQQQEAKHARWKMQLRNKMGEISAFEKVFTRFDRDKSGTLDRRELTEALRSLGLDADRQEVGNILQQMDVDRDGLVSASEFTSIVSKWITHRVDNNLSRQKNIE